MLDCFLVSTVCPGKLIRLSLTARVWVFILHSIESGFFFFMPQAFYLVNLFKILFSKFSRVTKVYIVMRRI